MRQRLTKNEKDRANEKQDMVAYIDYNDVANTWDLWLIYPDGYTQFVNIYNSKCSATINMLRILTLNK